MYKQAANQQLVKNTMASLKFDALNAIIYLQGAWLWPLINEKDLQLSLTQFKSVKEIKIDGSKIEYLDTIGAYFIAKLLQYLQKEQISLTELIVSPSVQGVLKQVIPQINQISSAKPSLASSSLISVVGRDTFHFYSSIVLLLAFFGQFCLNIIKFLKAPLNLQWSEVVRTIKDAGLKGMWVASLLCFLIGLTLAYEMSSQFITYGANVYIVNFLGISLLKEVAPLLTAIIVAGRTGASITAEIGVMKVQEEIDAIQTMGISPIKRLVLPKIIGVMIAVPLITAIADIASMLGGAIVANATLEVSYSLFIARLQTYVALSNYSCGIIKSIAFAFLISLVGCFCGFNVKGNANSIGEQTTKSVVLGIILVVFADAIFAMIFKALGI